MAINAPTNCWTAAEQAVAEGLASTAAYQALANAAGDPPAALETIHFETAAALATGAVDWSAAEIWTAISSADDVPYRLTTRATGRDWTPSGAVAVRFVNPLASDAWQNGAVVDELQRDWKNAIGDTLRQLWDALRVGAYDFGLGSRSLHLTAASVESVGTSSRGEIEGQGLALQSANLILEWNNA